VRDEHIALLFLGLLGVAVLAAWLVDRPPDTPSPEGCARLWNQADNADLRRLAAEQGFDAAVVYGWLAKQRYPGCAVLFRGAVGDRWMTFGGELHDGDVGFDSIVRGERWGFDSPEGGPEVPNASVSDQGDVRLLEF
jgi:hypothetical protein